MNEWTQRVSEGIDSGYAWGPFCQGELTPNNTETLNSSALCSSIPRYSWIFSALLFAFVFSDPAQETIVHSLRDLEPACGPTYVNNEDENSSIQGLWNSVKIG
ncbi:hypothetical protein CERZMDRAFT_100794 [Cercospora zeae-maydis SCOH1-5]|uniref:Uncharacterized protein n=1 Tax=Cercospora zeae-maydis SCOH1-5 TaxID=717836 RepID=A0A6A6F753_9PEZI|nr:hypothetical protein CERZMDRAFT_100794 [Cercospora zeae-maydis SCOH1-5]